jgi:hypothetical protein
MADTNFANPAVFTEQSSSATPPANTVALYPKTDGRFYGKDDAGTEFAFGTLGGTLGTVDNAVPRADGTGGVTAKGSDIVIDDATSTTQRNVCIRNNDPGATISALVLTPKGNNDASFIVGPKPNGAGGIGGGGNARGGGSIDIQLYRDTAGQVASGDASICIGNRNTASNTYSTAIGTGSLASAFGAVALGGGSASGPLGNEATATISSVFGGECAIANRYGMHARASGRFSANGDAQRARFVLRCKTTTNTGVEMALNGATTYLGIPANKVIALTINISGVKSDGSAVAHYLRQYCVKNVGGTSTEVYAPVTIGTDNAAGTTIALSVNNTDDTLRILVTGIASETWRWVAAVDAVEITYGT